MGGDEGGDDEGEGNDTRRKEGRSCREDCGRRAPDHGTNDAHPTFSLSVRYQMSICPSGGFPHTREPDPQSAAITSLIVSSPEIYNRQRVLSSQGK